MKALAVRVLGMGLALALGGLGCASEPSGAECAYVRTDGLCAAEVSLDPREVDSPSEATTLEVRWSWKGPARAGEVSERTVQYRMTAEEAAWRRAAWESLGRSRCTIEEPVAPCEGPRRIVFVEAEP